MAHFVLSLLVNIILDFTMRLSKSLFHLSSDAVGMHPQRTRPKNQESSLPNQATWQTLTSGNGSRMNRM